jgi:hypothetical protein
MMAAFLSFEAEGFPVKAAIEVEASVDVEASVELEGSIEVETVQVGASASIEGSVEVKGVEVVDAEYSLGWGTTRALGTTDGAALGARVARILTRDLIVGWLS